MSRVKGPYRGQARFIELGSLGAPFRSLINVDHISNVRFEQKIGEQKAEFDEDGTMTAPPQQVHEGWMIVIIIGHGAGGQNIFMPDEASGIALYNNVLSMIQGVGAPMARMPKMKPTPVASAIQGLDGAPIANDDELPGETPELTDEELDQLEHPEIDVDGIAEAIDQGLGADGDIDGVTVNDEPEEVDHPVADDDDELSSG